MHFRPPEEQNDHKVTCGVAVAVLQQVTELLQQQLDACGVRANVIVSGKGYWRCAPAPPPSTLHLAGGKRHCPSCGAAQLMQAAPAACRAVHPWRTSLAARWPWVPRSGGERRCMHVNVCLGCRYTPCLDTPHPPTPAPFPPPPPMSRFVDVVPLKAGKLEALEYVRRLHAFPLASTVACGDSGNDILMLSGGRQGCPPAPPPPPFSSVLGQHTTAASNPALSRAGYSPDALPAC
jgi:hypothetical protein